MPSRLAFLVLAVALAVSPRPTLGQSGAFDAEVEKGVRLAEDGDYDGAILTLDNAARRLAAEPAKVRDLSQAYLYLGIAYLGKGHEAAARAKFREALARAKDLTLSPEKFPPKVIDLFEAAREDATRIAAAEPAAPQPAATAAAPEKKKGRGRALLIGMGVAAAAGVGVAVAVGGGGGDTGTSVNPPAGPGDTRIVETFSGTLCGDFTICEQNRQFNIVVSGAGTLEATAAWTDARVQFTMELQGVGDRALAVSNRVTSTSAQLQAAVTPLSYRLLLDRQDEQPGPFPFTLVVRHP